MFTLYHSNHLDILKSLIAALMEQQPLSDPFAREVILVQSPGMAQWLRTELAEHFGITANIDYPLPATFIWQMFTQLLPDIPQESAFSKEAMTWKLLKLLPEQLSKAEFAAVAAYLDGQQSVRKSYQFAARIADLFDHYLVYRPEWLTAWQQGKRVDGLAEAQHWQATLWQALVNYTQQLEQPPWHRANLYRRFIDTLTQLTERPLGLPPRIFICGISALPPVYLDALRALGEHIDVHLMFTNPCRYYWGDIQDYAFLAKLQQRQRIHYQQQHTTPLFSTSVQTESLFDEEGKQQLNNPLLASWGKLGRDHLYLLSEQEGIREIDAFVDPGRETLLQRVQRDILLLQDLAIVSASSSEETSKDKQQLLHGDRSLSFHACHSAQREVEVLHDALLAMLDADPSLTPREIIVMVADIDHYTPYIQAVFGHAPQDRHIPFTISDRSVSKAHPLLQAFSHLLTLPESRFTVESILTLLEVPALAERFAIDEAGAQLLRQWIVESGICWGLDDESMTELDLPVTGQHTWQFGLTRMLLGYAMESRAGVWQRHLPYDASSGLIATLAGQLAELLACLTEWRRNLQQEKTLQEWLPIARELLDTFFITNGESEAALMLIEQQWVEIINHGLNAAFPHQLPLLILAEELSSRLEQQQINQRFLTGPVNFCTLMPMRSIPFKVICLLGMNDGAYPRTLPPTSFDLMVGQLRRGDRSRRDDDRYLFLEALLSAQQRLYISYIGRSIQDNSECYPSVLLSELMEYIAQSHCLPGDERLTPEQSAARVMQYLLCWHERVPFSPGNYLPGQEGQSYAAEWLPAASGNKIELLSFYQPLPPLPVTQIHFQDLVRFYRHPVKAFFQQRLEVSFNLQEELLAEEEPFLLMGLERYQLNVQLLNSLLSDKDMVEEFHRVKAAGKLPYGAFGEIYWQSQLQEMTALAERVRAEQSANEEWELDLQFEEIKICGWLHQVQQDGLLRWRPAELQITDGIQLWLEHLMYCALGGEGNSRLYGRKNQRWFFAGLPIAEAKQQLHLLLTGYLAGLQQPLLLPIKSAWAWLEHCFNRETLSIDWGSEQQIKAQEKLLQCWQGNRYQQGEGGDPYLYRLTAKLEPTDLQQITSAAERYLLPLAVYNQR